MRSTDTKRNCLRQLFNDWIFRCLSLDSGCFDLDLASCVELIRLFTVYLVWLLPVLIVDATGVFGLQSCAYVLDAALI